MMRAPGDGDKYLDALGAHVNDYEELESGGEQLGGFDHAFFMRVGLMLGGAAGLLFVAWWLA